MILILVGIIDSWRLPCGPGTLYFEDTDISNLYFYVKFKSYHSNLVHRIYTRLDSLGNVHFGLILQAITSNLLLIINQ